MPSTKGDSPAVFERLKILDDLGSANLSGMARRLASRAGFVRTGEEFVLRVLASVAKPGATVRIEEFTLAVQGTKRPLRRFYDFVLNGVRYECVELFSVFTTRSLFRVLHGRTELGKVDATSFQVRTEGRPVLILAGRNWQVTHIDWREHVAYVEPEEMDEKGRSRWPGTGGALHFDLCRAVRRVLTGVDPKAEISARARRALDDAREPFPWLDDASTVVVRGGDGPPRWWTFSGYLVNSALAYLSAVGHGARASDTGVEMGRAVDLTKLERDVRRLSTEDPSAWPKAPVAPEMARELKFEKCLPRELVEQMLGHRVDDSPGMRKTLAEHVRTVTVSAKAARND